MPNDRRYIRQRQKDRNITESDVRQKRGYVGFGRRFIAYMIDSLILSVLLGIVLYGFIIFLAVPGMASGENSFDQALLIVTLLVLGITWYYYAYFDSSQYMATPGKLICGIKVVGKDGNSINFAKATVRYILKSGIFFLFACLTYSANRSLVEYVIAGCLIADNLFILLFDTKTSLHDMVAGTYVVYK